MVSYTYFGLNDSMDPISLSFRFINSVNCPWQNELWGKNKFRTLNAYFMSAELNCNWFRVKMSTDLSNWCLQIARHHSLKLRRWHISIVITWYCHCICVQMCRSVFASSDKTIRWRRARKMAKCKADTKDAFRRVSMTNSHDVWSSFPGFNCPYTAELPTTRISMGSNLINIA